MQRTWVQSLGPPWSGKILHALWHLSPGATTKQKIYLLYTGAYELQLLEPTGARSPPVPAREYPPPPATRERPCTATKTQCSQK